MQKGLAFGGTQPDSSRIWVDAKELNSSTAMDDDFNYKPGPLIDVKAQNLQCVFIEVIGLQKDFGKSNFRSVSYKIPNEKYYDKEFNIFYFFFFFLYYYFFFFFFQLNQINFILIS